jgi:hypothetical protein
MHPDRPWYRANGDLGAYPHLIGLPRFPKDESWRIFAPIFA